MPSMDALARLSQLMEDRGWTMYRLAKECGIADSTIVNSYRRHTQPSIQTLEAICRGLGITLAQFFAEDENVEISPDLKVFLDLWINLTPEQKQAVQAVMQAFQHTK